MKTAAIIAEYNPFHNGHRYQIEETRRATGADFILVIMSGDFVQRGAPALCNKYIRTRMALLNGADVVIELPALYAVSSAEYFAQGAVTLLNRLGVIDYLSFGSESGNLPLIKDIADLLLSDSPEYRDLLHSFLKKGLSYPAARWQAVSILLFSGEKNASSVFCMELLANPNNILGLEYCKALTASQSTIQPFTVKRAGSGYHDPVLQQDAHSFSSASAIRHAICRFGSASAACHGDNAEPEYKNQVPSSVYQLLEKNQVLSHPITSNDFSAMLHYKLLTKAETGFHDFLDCSTDLSDKICKQLPHFTSFTDFCSLLKSKDITYTRISRILLHILLDLKQQDSFRQPMAKRTLALPYARLLGFKKAASPLLSAMKKNSSVPMISKLADASLLLTEKEYFLLQTDIRCAQIYEAARYHLTGESPVNEFRQSPIVI